MATKCKQCIALDPEALRLLQVLAQETEGNLSMAARRAIRETARARGLVSEGVTDERR